MDEIGKVFLNRFRVDMLLSTGDSYTRYRGFDLKRGAPVSIRVYDLIIPPDRAVLCFQQNSQTLQTMMHPNISAFYGLYEAEGKSFSVEGFVEGPSLAQILRQRRGAPIPPIEALTYIKALVSGLEYTHGFGLVHSTISPSNIQATRDGAILLTNFGFSRLIDNRMSDAGAYGPPFCQAPEQLRREKVYPATDIYALGTLFYEFVTGTHPFLGLPSSAVEDDTALAERLSEGHLNQTPPDARIYNASVPEGLVDTLQIALAKDYHDRYQSAQEMLEISCAVLGVNPAQTPDRIGSRAAVPATQVAPQGPTSPQVAVPGGVYVSSTQAASPPPGVDAYGRPAPIPGTQVVSGQPYGGVQAGYTAAYDRPYMGGLEAEKPKRAKWLAPLIIGLVAVALLCGVLGVWAGGSFLGGLFGSKTDTPTPTLTLAPTLTPLPPTPLPTLPPPVPPTEVPPVVIPPTAPPLPPTQPPVIIPSPTKERTAFKVTILNNYSQYIWAFRDGSIMGTDPIPPGKYIWYLNIPGGPHQFYFCVDITGSQCPFAKQVNVNDDITIRVK